MASQIHPFSITAPGFWGLNSQDAPVDMDPRFSLEANNCIIDRYGRVGSRKGWAAAHAASAALGTSAIGSIRELIALDGTSYLIAAGNNKLFKLASGTLTQLTYGGGGVAPTISGDNWQSACINNAMVLFQVGHDPLVFDTGLSTTTYRRLSEVPTYSGSAPSANCAISAFGRLWAATTSANSATVYWSDLLTHHHWTGGSSGSLDLTGVWPDGSDEIVAIAAHNNRLIIFGRRQIVIYKDADDPTMMSLDDTISGVGCVGRDTVQNAGEDIIFMSDSGVLSLMRTIQEKSAPLRRVSKQVNDAVIDYMLNSSNGTMIKSIYSPVDSFYLLTFIDGLITYCFDLRAPLDDGSSRVTVWYGIRPQCYFYTRDRSLYIGMAGYIGTYGGYTDNGSSYRMTYFTSWVDFGNPIQQSILKKITMTLYGTFSQSVVYKWGFDYASSTRSQVITLSDESLPSEYNVAEYGIDEYVGNLLVQPLSVNAGGNGKVIQIGLEVEVKGYPISVQRVDILTKDGKI